MLSERKTLLIAAIIGICICLLPIIGFVLFALWPYKVLVSWLILGTIGLVIVVLLTLRIMKALTATTVVMHEQSLRPQRLYDYERLVSEDRYGFMAQPMQQARPTSSNAAYRYEGGPGF